MTTVLKEMIPFKQKNMESKLIFQNIFCKINQTVKDMLNQDENKENEIGLEQKAILNHLKKVNSMRINEQPQMNPD